MKRTGNYVRLFYHFIWTTKERIPIIDSVMEQAVHKVARAKARELGFTIIAINGPEDHIHMLVQAPTTLTPAEIAKHVKGSSSHFVNHEVLSGKHPRRLDWQDGYGVVTVSPKDVETIRRYIENQKRHHRDHTTRPGQELSVREC